MTPRCSCPSTLSTELAPEARSAERAAASPSQRGGADMAYTEESRAAASPNIPQQRPDATRTPEATGWLGWVTFGGIVMVLIGFFGAIEGIAALFREQV